MGHVAHDGRIGRDEMCVRAKAEHVLVEHAGDFLRGIGDALAGGGQHRLLYLPVAEARDDSDDDEDECRNEERQLAAQWLLLEWEGQDTRPHFDLKKGRDRTPEGRIRGVWVTTGRVACGVWRVVRGAWCACR